MTAVIDYDAGNIRSVEKALMALGEEVVVTRDKDTILKADIRPSAAVTVISVLPEPPSQSATGKESLYALSGFPSSVMVTCTE